MSNKGSAGVDATSIGDLKTWFARLWRTDTVQTALRNIEAMHAGKTISPLLVNLGVPWDRSWTTAACGKGWWRMSHLPATQQGMSVK